MLERVATPSSSDPPGPGIEAVSLTSCTGREVLRTGLFQAFHADGITQRAAFCDALCAAQCPRDASMGQRVLIAHYFVRSHRIPLYG